MIVLKHTRSEPLPLRQAGLRGRRRAAALLALLALLAAVAASGQEAAVFRRSLDRVASLDPAQAASVYAGRAVGLVYETLVEYDYEARPYRLIPGLAESLPEVADGGRVYTFRLVTNAWFDADPCFGLTPDGRAQRRRVEARDVVFSLKRLADAKLASSGAWLVKDQILGMRAFAERSAGGAPTDYSLRVEGLRALDDRTVRIELVRPSPEFVWTLAMPYAAAVPQEAVERYGRDFGTRAVGSAAYRLASWRRNYEMVFERVPAWRGWAGASGRPFDRISYRVMEDASTQWLSFLAGELDFLGEIARDNWDAVIGPDGTLAPALVRRGVRLHSLATLEVAYVAFNFEDPVVGRNPALRRALNCAFDGARWEAFYNNRVVRADGAVPPQVAGHLDESFPWAFDLERARALLAEAGYPGGVDPATGRRLSLTLDLGRTTQDVRETTELLCAFFERIGIDLQPRYQNWPAFLERVSRRETQMFRIGWVGDYPDALNFLQLFYGPNQTPGPNRCNFRDPAFDALYDEAVRTPGEAERLDLYRRMQAIIREACPWIFIHFPRAYSLSGPRVERYIPHDFPYGMEKYLRVGGR
jgi:ABC-type transport system substrate-binding protein